MLNNESLTGMERPEAMLSVLADHVEDCLYEGISIEKIKLEVETVHAWYLTEKEDYCDR